MCPKQQQQQEHVVTEKMYLHLICFALAEQQARGAREAKRAQQRQVRGGEEQKRGRGQGCESSSSRYSGVTQARISSQFTSSSSTFLLVSVSIYTHTCAQVQAQACKHVCVCIDVSKDVPAELETKTTTRAKTSFARVLFPARTLFILVHTYKSVKRVAAAASPPLPYTLYNSSPEIYSLNICG